MDNFDLKKYLVENKVTRNSRIINEVKEDPFSFLDIFITPVNEHNPQLVAKVKSILDAYEISELEQGIDTFGEALIEYFEEYDQHWPGKPNGMANNLWDAKLLATVKAYKNGTADIKKTVSQFRKVLSNPRHYEPKHSRLMNEESGNFTADFTQAHNTFVAQTVQKGDITHYYYDNTITKMSKGGRYKNPTPITKLALSTLKAAGVDSVEKLYSMNNKEYNGETVEDFFSSLKVDMSYSGFGYTLLPGVYVSFEDYQGE